MVYLGNKKMLEKEVNKNDLVSPVKGPSPAKGTGKPEKASKPMSTPLPRVMSVKPANSILDDLFALDGFSFGLAGVPTGQVSTITAKPTTEPDSFEALATAQAGFQNAGMPGTLSAQAGFQNAGMPGTLSAQPDNPERVATAQAAGMVSGANGANDANNPFNVQSPSQKAKPEVPNMIVFEQPSRRAASLERLKKKLEAEQANQKEIAAARAAAEQAAAEEAVAKAAGPKAAPVVANAAAGGMMPPPSAAPPPAPPPPGQGKIAKGPHYEEMQRKKAEAEKAKKQAQEAKEERLKQEAKAKREKQHGAAVPAVVNNALLADPKFLRIQAMAKEYEHDPKNIEHVHGDARDPPTLSADSRRCRSATPRSKAGRRAGSRSSNRSNSAARAERATEAANGDRCGQDEWDDLP